MAQKMNSKQLKEVYFNSAESSSDRYFNDALKNKKVADLSLSFSESKKDYQRYSKEQVAQFEKFFNRHEDDELSEGDVLEPSAVMPAPPETQEAIDYLSELESLVAEVEHRIEKDFVKNPSPPLPSLEPVQMSQLEKDLLEKDLFENFLSDDDEVYSEPDTEDVLLNDDLHYLNSLVSTGGSKSDFEALNSIENLLGEIVDNEKSQISNYETDVFNANVQSLFDSDPEADDEVGLPTSPTVTAPALEVMPETDRVVEVEVKDEVVEQLVSVADSKQEPELAPPPLRTFPSIESDENSDQADSEKSTTASIEDLRKDVKSKNIKIKILDTILVLLLVIITVFLLYYFEELLPFNLPNLPFDIPFIT
ncbi:MAG: hypothetical protein FWE07_06690 [Turicibacter sp.]|nr:hypothetical protein [Turicibacter sp.]